MRTAGNTDPLPQTRHAFEVEVEHGATLVVTEVRGAADGPTLAIVAGVHGDEVECIAALEDWLEVLSLQAGRVVAIPVAHSAALAIGTRLGPDGVDLNRVAPGDPRAHEPTRRLAHALTRLLADEADVLMTLHSWSRSGETVPYVEYPAGGDAAMVGAATELAHALGLPWAEPWDWPAGLVPAVLCRAGVPSVEVEVGGLGRTTAGGQMVVRQALEAAVAHLGLGGEAAPLPRAATVDRSWVRAPVAGRVRQLVPLGTRVRAGQTVAHVRGCDGAVREALAADVAGTLAIHVTYGMVAAGDPVAAIFTPR